MQSSIVDLTPKTSVSSPSKEVFKMTTYKIRYINFPAIQCTPEEAEQAQKMNNEDIRVMAFRGTHHDEKPFYFETLWEKCEHIEKNGECTAEGNCYVSQFSEDDPWILGLNESHEKSCTKSKHAKCGIWYPTVWSGCPSGDRLYYDPDNKTRWLICIKGWDKPPKEPTSADENADENAVGV
jgi:hypothetical protein